MLCILCTVNSLFHSSCQGASQCHLQGIPHWDYESKTHTRSWNVSGGKHGAGDCESQGSTEPICIRVCGQAALWRNTVYRHCCGLADSPRSICEGGFFSWKKCLLKAKKRDTWLGNNENIKHNGVLWYMVCIDICRRASVLQDFPEYDTILAQEVCAIQSLGLLYHEDWKKYLFFLNLQKHTSGGNKASATDWLPTLRKYIFNYSTGG